MLKVLFLGLVFGAFHVHALIEFSVAEKTEHQAKLPLIVQTAAQCLDDTYADHIRFHDRYRPSKYYGNRRKDYRTLEQRANALRAAGFSEVQAYEIARQQVGTACITMAMQCLEQGFQKAGGLSMTSWNKINAHIRAVDYLGTDLQIALQDLGWKIYYWNPSNSVEQMKEWDLDDRRIAPLRASEVAAGRRNNPVWAITSLTSATPRAPGSIIARESTTRLRSLGSVISRPLRSRGCPSS